MDCAETLLARMMENGWITEFSVLGGGGIHVRWTEDGQTVAWAFSRAAMILMDERVGAGAALFRWLNERSPVQTEDLESLRPFLTGVFFQLADLLDTETWNLFLKLCIRDAPMLGD